MSKLPTPLTPADCDLRDFAFIPIDVRRLLSSETWLLGNGEERAAAMALWLESWHQVPAGSLPINDKMLAHLSQAGQKWNRVKDHCLRGWVECSDGRIYHPVVAEKALEAWIEKLANSISGANGNSKRWGLSLDTDGIRGRFNEAVSMLRAIAPQSRALKKKIVATISASSPPDRHPIAPGSPPDSASSPPESPPDRKGQGQGQGQVKPSPVETWVGAQSAAPPSQTLPPDKPAAATRGSRLPDDWRLPKAWGEWALAERPDLAEQDVRREAEQFADYWRAKAGAGARKADWEACWRNWVRRCSPASADGRRVNGRQPRATPDAGLSIAEHNRRAFEEARKLIFGDAEENTDAGE